MNKEMNFEIGDIIKYESVELYVFFVTDDEVYWSWRGTEGRESKEDVQQAIDDGKIIINSGERCSKIYLRLFGKNPRF